MAMWTSWMVLAVCTVITQSFPQPDEYQIPEVPYGKRAQYYVLHDDGDFKYGYDTGEGAYETAVKMGAGDVIGFFGYNDAFGDKIRVDYTAGVEGFVPTGNNLPEVPVPSVRSYKAPVASSQAAVKSALTPVRPFEEADIDSTNNLDGSYRFSFVNSDSSRSESADASNNVVGHYSFVADDGVNRRIDYRAGSATGYVAEGDSVPESPTAPAAPAAPAAPTLYNAPARSDPAVLYSAPTPAAVQYPNEPRGDASYSFQYQTDGSSREESADSDLNVVGRYSFIADDGVRRSVKYIAGSATGFVAEGNHLPVAPEAGAPAPTQYSAPARSAPASAQVYSSPSSKPRGDASYQFSYQNSDSSRSESSDSDLNVKGDYSFVADDGQLRTVNYVAGSSTGFVAQGDHLPVAPEAPAVPQPAPAQLYSAPRPSDVPTASEYGAVITSGPRRDASYNFRYENADSSRSETADSDLNIQGEYSFVGDDGKTRRVSYRAGSGTGFVAEGDHLPVDEPISPAFTAASTYPASSSAGYSGQTASGSVAPSFKTYQGESADITSNQGVDGSYSFSYSNSDSSRSESADASNNVVGQYSFVADDGVNRQINYIAGSATGYVAEGDSIPVAPVVPAIAAAAPASPYSAPVPPVTLYSAPVVLPSTSVVTQPRGDASYSFSYTNDDSSRSESADSDLNVEGFYSFVADDGVHRQVNYKAGSSTGFVAEGDHLPVAADLPSVAAPTTYAGTGPQVLVKSAPTAPVVSHEAANIRSNLNADGSYSFSYANSDSSRSETADASNNVVGQYSFVADDGVNRQINYIAGSATGYVAEGDSLPVAPEVPVSAPASATVYSAPARSPPVPLYSAPTPSANEQSFVPRGDASYSFSYTNDDSAREESADSDLNVKGRFSFVADDGIERSVNYIAGSATGFVAEGDHLPVAPVVSGAAPSQATVYSGSASRSGSGSVGGFAGSGAGRGDASYSFNYATDDSSRDETADRDLNVKGSYSFVADDGVKRTVDYIAGSGTGFVADGDHLPVQDSDTASSTGFRSSGSSSSHSSSSSSPSRFTSGSSTSSGSSSVKQATVYSYPETTKTVAPAAGSSSARIIGNVRLRQYPVVPGRTKFGYVFTEI